MPRWRFCKRAFASTRSSANAVDRRIHQSCRARVYHAPGPHPLGPAATYDTHVRHNVAMQQSRRFSKGTRPDVVTVRA